MTSEGIAQITEGFEDEKLAVAAATTAGVNLRTFSEGGISFLTNGRMVIFGNEGSKIPPRCIAQRVLNPLASRPGALNNSARMFG